MEKYYGEAVNVSELYYAEVTQDVEDAYTAGTPAILAPVATIAKETATNTKTRFYSGKALYVDTSEGDTVLTIVVPGLTVKTRAELLGKLYDETTGMMYDDGVPGEKYFALGYSVAHAGGKDEFVWLLKGKFSIPRDEVETKTENINEKTLSVTFTAICTKAKFQLTTTKTGNTKAVYGDTGDEAFTKGASWFNAVVTPPAIQEA